VIYTVNLQDNKSRWLSIDSWQWSGGARADVAYLEVAFR
jgi:hypothetical protein